MKSKAYWKRRSAMRMVDYQKQADKTANEIAKSYVKAANYINDEMAKIFRTFEVQGGLSEQEALRLLNNLPDKWVYDSLKETVKTVKDPAKRRALLSVINSPAYAYRIRRFEELQKDIDRQTKNIAAFEKTVTRAHYISLAGLAFEHAVFDIQKGIGFSFPFSRMSESRVTQILKRNWSGKLFSERIWDKEKNINAKLKEELLTQFMTGRSYKKTAENIQNAMAVGAMEARRLVRTESTYIANCAEMESYTACGIKKFKFLATLDMRTSEICASMDGKTFDVDKAVPGTNVPPLHPWCRSTTVAVIDSAAASNLERRARDPKTGKTYLVPEDMSYADWKKSIDERYGKGTWETERKMLINRPNDMEQYKRYKSILGKENMPKTFDMFRDLKYNNVNKYKYIKVDYQRQNKLREHPELALPNSAVATADDRKFTHYLFNPDNPKGYSKGAVISSRLGYDINNYSLFKDDILKRATRYTAINKGTDQYGTTYEQKMIVYGLNDNPTNVVVGWKEKEGKTWLTSAYVKELK